MSDDEMFRWCMLANFVVLLPVALYHRIRSAASGEKLDRRQEGVLLMVSLRLSGVPYLLGLLAFLIQPAWMEWSTLPLPVWLRWVGVGMGTLSIAVVFWTFHNLGTNLTDTAVTRKKHTLVTTGPYRWVRHPFYIGVALSLLGGALAAANWFLALPACVILTLLALRTPIEERKLIERFGDEYREYMKRTGRFFPWPG